MKRQLHLLCFAAIFLASCKKDLNPNFTETSATVGSKAEDKGITEFSATDEFVPNEMLVRFKPEASQTGRANALAHIGGKIKEHVHTGAMKDAGDTEGFDVVQVPNGVLNAIEKIKAMADVETAEPNYILRNTPLVEPDDPYYTGAAIPNDHLWGMAGEWTPLYYSYGSRAGEAWTGAIGRDATGPIYGNTPQTGSEKVYVAVIDEGIQYDHPDLLMKDANNQVVKQQVANRLEVAGIAGLDDDGNGYIDDLYGWNFVNNNNAVFTPGADSHGTHVAGTIGAIGNNGIGVAGVCWNISIISAKFMSSNGGTTDAAIKALDYVTKTKYYPNGTLRYNIVATNNSWGGGSKSTLLQAAITRSEDKGILFVAAAGNNGVNTDSRTNYPSCYSNASIISVASIKPDGTRSSFSNYGLKTVDIAAPGNYIWSTTPAGYEKYSGTSMAAPHVTGAVALYAAANNMTNVDKTKAQIIKNAILNSARPTKSMQGLCVTGGRLDVNSAWQNINNKGLPAN